MSAAPQQFSVPYFLVAILFLILILSYFSFGLLGCGRPTRWVRPHAAVQPNEVGSGRKLSIYDSSLFGYWIFIIFTLILTIGFVYELAAGVSIGRRAVPLLLPLLIKLPFKIPP